MSLPLTQPNADAAFTWYAEGQTFFAAMLAAIAAARVSVRLETYIYEAGGVGARVAAELEAAARRGVRVQVLVDAFGSSALPGSFWDSLRAAGGEARVFNPVRLNWFAIRNHRKLLVCDDAVALLGGFNIAPNYEGNGVTHGWRDVAVQMIGALAAALGETFDRLFVRASFEHKRWLRFRRSGEKLAVSTDGCQLLLSGPGRGGSPLERALRQDLQRAATAQLMVAYFLPSRRLRYALTRMARRGGAVKLMLPGETDIALSKLAAESFYRRLLGAGIHIMEYQPQILHAKLFIIGAAVYVGSSNLDPRSLKLNYEVMVRLEDPAVAAAAREIFATCQTHCREVTRAEWRHGRSLWTRLKQRFARFVLARLDPWISLAQWRALPD